MIPDLEMFLPGRMPDLSQRVTNLAQTDPILGHITTIRHVSPIGDMMCIELAVFRATFPALVVVSGKDSLPERFTYLLLF
jgi:hypothetical protein